MTDNPLTELSYEQQEALAEIAKSRVDGGISRRDAMKAAGALGVGGLLGGGAATAATGDARADPQGNLGTPDDPWDTGYFQTVRTGELNGTIEPAPGEVQNAIDTVDAQGYGMVRLRSDTYSLGGIDTMGVTIDASAAIIEPANTVRVFNVYPGTTILNPRIDVSSVNFDGDVFRFDSNWDKYTNQDGDKTRVIGGWSMNDSQTGNVILVSDANETGITGLEVNHNTHMFQNSIRLNANNADSWVNGNRFSGYNSGARRGIYTTGSGVVRGNSFYIDCQLGSSSYYGWELNTGGQNTYIGTIFDSDGADGSWRIGSGAEGKNAVILTGSAGATDYVVDDLGDSTNIMRHAHELSRRLNLEVVTTDPAAGDLDAGEAIIGDGTGPNGDDEIFWSSDGSTIGRIEADSIIQ